MWQKDRIFDVAVIGGGILGTSVARDCAMRRLSVVLFEKDDLASGATGCGSGILSAEPAWVDRDLGVVRRLAEEVSVLQRIAPHLLTLTPFWVPYFSEREGHDIEARLWAYQKFSWQKGSKPHTRFSVQQARRIEPGLSSGVRGVVSFDEWIVDPVRLTIAIARSASSAGASIHTRTPVEGIEVQSGKVVGVRVRKGGQVTLVRCRTAVNAAGAAVGEVDPKILPQLRFRHFRRFYIGFERRLTQVGIAWSAGDRPPRLFYPRGDVQWLGPFETREPHGADGELGDKALSDLLQDAARIFPQIVQSRPHAIVEGKHCDSRIGFQDVLPRDFLLRHHLEGVDGLITLAGGSLMRARTLAQSATDRICRSLGLRETCRTHLESLPGCATDHPWIEQAHRTGLNPLAVKGMMRRQGYFAHPILDQVLESKEAAEVLCACEQITAAEVEYCVRNEWATDLAGVSRRTGLGRSTCQGAQCAAKTAGFLAKLLNRDSAWEREQLQRAESPHHWLQYGSHLSQWEMNRNRQLFSEGNLL